jgi:hypothetical protein|nr:MAG TPA: hypothetical protein [Crassvirales sp.]
MANYSLVINSQFKPFSYQEMLAPTLMATQAHQELENQYGELATKASVWEEMANEQTDPYAYKMYKTYANDLEAQAGQLAREGLNAASRRDMLNMRARYSKEITPIEQAYATRQKQAEQQQQALLQDPTLMLSRKASTTSLDDYIKNPQLAYEAYSGKLITAQAASAASALAKEMQEQPRKWRSILGNSYYETMMQKGFSSQAVLQAIQDNPNAAPQLTRIVEDAINSSGVRNWGDQATIARAIDYAKQGLWSAVGETQYQTLDNWRAKMAAQEAMQIRAEKRAAARKAAEQKQAQLNNLAINPLNIYSSRELSKDEKKYKDILKNYSKYFYRDANGRIRMTWKGWQEYNRNATPRVSISASGSGTARLMNAETQIQSERKFTPTGFRTFMDSIGAKNVKGWQPGNLGNVWGRYITDSPAAKTSRYDATRVTEYDYPIAGTQQGDMKDAIMTAGRGLSLKEVDYDSKSKKFKDTGEEITMENLKSDKYKVTATRFSPYGTTVMIQDDKGNVRRYRMPAGINTTNEQNRDRAMTAANQWQQVVSTGQYTDARGNVHQATPDEITYAQQQYANSIQEAYLYHSQLGVQNKTKEQEFNPYGY